jgi:hypothetical protein
MSLIIVYVVLVVFGQAVAVAIGVAVDSFSKALGLLTFLALYFVAFVVCWKVAVRLTAPGGLIETRYRR